MVKNLGSYIRIYCMEHDKPVPFVPVQNHPQFICARNFKKDDEHPDGYEDTRCNCMIKFDDYFRIVEKMESIVEKDSEDRTEAHYKGMKFNEKNLSVTVINHTDKHIDLGLKYIRRSFI